MSAERTRGLDPEWTTLVAPHLPPEPPKDAPIDLDRIRGASNSMTAGKERALQGPWKELLTSVTVENIKIPMRDGHLAEMRIIKPASISPSTTLPVYYSCHGGGFIMGDNHTEELINRQLAHEAGVIVFSIDYRLAPEYPVTTVLYADVEDGAKWTWEHAAEYGGDVKKAFIVGGTSVGALLSQVIAFRAEKLGVKPTGMLLRQPATRFGPPKKEWESRLLSLEENADAPLLNKAMMDKITDMLAIPEEQLQDPWYFPVHGTPEELARFPPAYIIIASIDPGADDVVLLDDLLRGAGVTTKTKTYEGMPHGFHGFHDLTKARQEMKDTPEGLKWLLSFS